MNATAETTAVTLEKLNKLITSTKPNCSADEAEQIASKALKLISGLQSPADETTDIPEGFGHYADDEYYEESWVVNLWTSLSRLYYCGYAKGRKTIKGRRLGNPRQIMTHTVIGRRANAEVTRLVATFLTNSVRLRAKEAAKEEVKGMPPGTDSRPLENKHKREEGALLVERIRALYDRAAKGDRVSIYDAESKISENYKNEVFERKEFIQRTKAQPDESGFIEGLKNTRHK